MTKLFLNLFIGFLACLCPLMASAQQRVAPVNVPSRAGGEVTIYASLISADSWDPSWLASSEKGYAVYSMTPTAPSFTNVSGVAAGLNAVGGGFFRNGHYYALSYWTSMGFYYVTTLNEWDATTWELVRSTRTEVEEAASDMTYDPVTDKVYGCFMKEETVNGAYAYEWGTFDTETAKRTIIADLPERLGAVAADGKGRIYGIGARGSLYSIDPATGATTKIGNTGHNSYNLGSGVIDERTGDFYWFCYPNVADSYLFRVDTATAETTLVYELPDGMEFCGAYILPPAAQGSAPDFVSDFAADFPGASLTGTLSFTLPTTDYDGAALTGTLSYTVETEGSVCATGNGEPGEKITITYTAPEGGCYYTFDAYASNATKGASSTLRVWVGEDVPAAVSDISITRSTTDETAFTITWKAPTTTEHGGNLVDLTYDVVRLPDNVKVATRTAATSVSDKVPANAGPTRYSYQITPYNGTCAGPSATSAEVVVGTVTLPYLQDFATEASFGEMTVIDANHDGMTWTWFAMAGGNKETTATCNTPEYTPQDDWLITPGFYLRPGRLYRLSFYPTCRYNLYHQKVAAYLGQGTNVADMTRELVPVTTVTADIYDSPTRQQIVQTFTVDAEGTYFVGFHALSDPDTYYLHLDNILIEEASSDGVPAAVSDLAITPDPTAELRATVSFTAPDKTVIGKSLASISRIEVERDGQPVHTFNSPAVGAQLSWTDTEATAGYCTYTVTAHNAEGMSDATSCKQWVGFDVPEAPAAATVSRSGDKALITWQAPQVGTHGGVVVPERLVYDVLWGKDRSAVATGISTLSVTDAPVLEQQQELIQYYVRATTPNGDTSAAAPTNKVVYGTPYTMPVAESFAGAATSVSPWFVTTVVGDGWYSTWNLTSRGLAPYTTPYDGDGGMAMCSMDKVGDRVRYSTPLISLADAKRPILEFFYYFDQGSKDRLHVEVAPDGQDYTTVATIDYAKETGENGWRFVAVELPQYAGTPCLQIAFTGEKFDATTHTLQVDNIVLHEFLAVDLAIESISVPRVLMAGQPNTISAKVKNAGTETVAAATVRLYCDDAVVATETISNIAPGTMLDVEFSVEPPINCTPNSTYYAEVVAEGDANHDNDCSLPVTTRNQEPLYPRISDLTYDLADASDGQGTDVQFTWSNPALDGSSGTRIIDEFEDYAPFIIDHIGRWTVADETKAYTYGVGGVTYDNAYGPAAFQVFNPSKINLFSGGWTPHSGEQMLVSFDAATYDPTDLYAYVPPTDHWLISPLLPGTEQTVTFYARSVTTTYGFETFRILVNTADDTNSTSSFTPLEGTAFEAPGEWTKITFTVPEGTNRFAIRHTSYNQYALLIDDITYTSAEATPEDIELLGYNIYCDGQRQNTVLLLDNCYAQTFRSTEAMNHNYNVTAVYDKGESAFSNTVNPTIPMGIIAPMMTVEGHTSLYDLQGRRANSDALRAAPDHRVIVSDGRKVLR